MKFKKKTVAGVPGLECKRITITVIDRTLSVVSNYTGELFWWYEVRSIIGLICDSIRHEKEVGV